MRPGQFVVEDVPPSAPYFDLTTQSNEICNIKYFVKTFLNLPCPLWFTRDVLKPKVFHIITKLELGGAQKVTLMTLERLPRDRYDLGLVTGPEGLLVDWANRIPDVK